MTVEEKVQALLEAAAGVTALVPTARISVPNDRQSMTRPYIRHFPVDLDLTYLHEGRAAMNGWGYQISIFADTYSAARTAVAAVVAAIEGTRDQATFFWRGMTYLEEAVNEVRVHQIALSFEVFEAL